MSSCIDLQSGPLSLLAALERTPRLFLSDNGPMCVYSKDASNIRVSGEDSMPLIGFLDDPRRPGDRSAAAASVFVPAQQGRRLWQPRCEST